MDHITESIEIYKKYVNEFKPAAIVIMFSGGDDSLTVLNLCKEFNLHFDAIIHGNTRTGLNLSTKFARETCKDENYMEADAGDSFEKYVRRKGFFGSGIKAHSYAYHVLKASAFRKELSKIRQRRRDFNILCLNGVRVEESVNRADNYGDEVYRRDPAMQKNIWLNLIHYWTKEDCLEFLSGINAKRSEVAKCLGRSGECMCGTMQTIADRIEASKFDPDWGKWLDNLENDIIRDFPWRWGSSVPKSWKLEKEGQGNLFTGFHPDFQPACVGCKAKKNSRR
jgi:3'-phosphoadenosine 5'-phosphosulfate sulfotransferase (PAPS reductase)/FAD synthetase